MRGPGTRQDVTILFADLRGFTRISEILSAEQTDRLRQPRSSDHDRTGDAPSRRDRKFIGDLIMAFWDRLHRTGDHAHRPPGGLEQRGLLDRLRGGSSTSLRRDRAGRRDRSALRHRERRSGRGSVGPPQSQTNRHRQRCEPRGKTRSALKTSVADPGCRDDWSPGQASRPCETSPLDVRGRAILNVFSNCWDRAPVRRRSRIELGYRRPLKTCAIVRQGQVPRRKICVHGAVAGNGTPSS